MNRGKVNILLITEGDFVNKSVATNIDKLIKVLLNITNNIILITQCDKKLILNVDKESIRSLKAEGSRVKRFIFSQILISKAILSIYCRNNIGIVMFAFGQDLQLLPLILAKIVSKSVVIRSDGRPSLILKRYIKNHSLIKRYLFRMIEEIDYRLADIIVTECDYMISENNFQKYKYRKGGNLFVDMNTFMDKTGFHNRTYDIGFVGRLSQEKGILNFLKALELLNRNLNVLIIGDGEEKDSVLLQIEALRIKMKTNVEYIGWIENNKLPNYLNEIKIIVVPSYKEGLPNIMLESMVCGCILLATPVGGIPGVIKDGESGFILEDNSPETIVRGINRALSYPNLEQVAVNARTLVERDFTFEAAVERWRKILADVL